MIVHKKHGLTNSLAYILIPHCHCLLHLNSEIKVPDTTIDTLKQGKASKGKNGLQKFSLIETQIKKKERRTTLRKEFGRNLD